MTPKTLILTAVVSIMTATQAMAFGGITPMNPPRYPGPGPVRPGPIVRPGPVNPGPGRPGPVRPGPVRPGPVYPGPVYPGPIVRPDPIRPYPPGPIYPAPINRYIQKVIYIGRYVDYETLYLQQLGDLFYSAQGYVLESVEVDARSSSYNATLRLLVNGYTEDTDYNVSGYSKLYPSYNRVFGRDLSTLALRLDGSAYIDRITVNLRLD